MQREIERYQERTRESERERYRMREIVKKTEQGWKKDRMRKREKIDGRNT